MVSHILNDLRRGYSAAEKAPPAAGATYALAAAWCHNEPHWRTWPWLSEWWKPTTRRRDLVKAGALILAEIERLDRAGEGPLYGPA